MKKRGRLKSSVLVSAVALSLFPSPANAVSEDVVREYWPQNSGSWQTKPQASETLKPRNDEQQRYFGPSITPPGMSADMDGYQRPKRIYYNSLGRR